MEEQDILKFLNQNIHARFKDGNLIKSAEGRLVSASNGFMKIAGVKGVIIINEVNFVKAKKMP